MTDDYKKVNRNFCFSETIWFGGNPHESSQADRAAKLTEHPSFRLMRQTDVQNVWHMQMPRWLFSDPRYADMSLDAENAEIGMVECTVDSILSL